jgi:hypothetical protein
MRVSIGFGKAECAVEALEVSYAAFFVDLFFVLVIFWMGSMACILVFALFTLGRRVWEGMTVTLAVKGGNGAS